MPTPDEALPGRPDPIVKPGRPPDPGHSPRRPVAGRHADRHLRSRLLLGRREGVLAAPRCRDDGRRLCRWHTPNPTYEESCTGRTGHAEVVLVAFDPSKIATSSCSRPSGRTTTRPRRCARATTSGREYRSIILTADDEQRRIAEASRDVFQTHAVGQGLRRDHDRDRARPARSTTPRTTTSSTSTGTRAATARSTRPA